ncbi:protein NDR1-like [Mercurialis annua]|uniref:protein NDR1-like n=1 Tax=Mercurialis annua TaxID=3986 RepID=UPI00215E1E20|nr:protein NDR1-like [Mercurialis annua]
MCVAKTFIIWLLQFIFLLGLFALFLWLAIRPKHPTFTIDEFSVPNNQNSSTDADQDFTLTYTLEISNSNKDSVIYYDDIFLIFNFGQDTLKRTKIPSFKQDKDKTRSIQVMERVDSSQKVQKTLVKEIWSGQAELKVDLSTKIRYKTWGFKSKHHGMELHASIHIDKVGKISGKKKKVKFSKKKMVSRAARFH